uniref:Myosin heavy chain n=1 Tax=Anisakis simplex TaxID=6269 RepID=A0A0M3JF93_ANISI
LEAKLNDSLKAVDELQKLAADAIEERSASAQKAVEDCRNEVELLELTWCVDKPGC